MTLPVQVIARWRGIRLVNAPCCVLSSIMIVSRVGSLHVFECPECLATFTVFR